MKRDRSCLIFLLLIAGCSRSSDPLGPAAVVPFQDAAQTEQISPGHMAEGGSNTADGQPDVADNTPPPHTLDELLLFFPSKYPAGNWKPVDLQFEDVWIKMSDGNKVVHPGSLWVEL